MCSYPFIFQAHISGQILIYDHIKQLSFSSQTIPFCWSFSASSVIIVFLSYLHYVTYYC